MGRDQGSCRGRTGWTVGGKGKTLMVKTSKECLESPNLNMKMLLVPYWTFFMKEKRISIIVIPVG